MPSSVPHRTVVGQSESMDGKAHGHFIKDVLMSTDTTGINVSINVNSYNVHCANPKKIERLLPTIIITR